MTRISQLHEHGRLTVVVGQRYILRNIYYPHHVGIVGCGSHLAFYSIGSAGDSSEVKPLGREADNSPSSNSLRGVSSELQRDSFIVAVKNRLYMRPMQCKGAE
jgi:hypothetical protein